MMSTRIPILQVEDEEHDVIFLQYALERAQVKNPLAVVRDGREAIAYLRGEGRFADRQDYPLPGLVLLDLRLPWPGLEVLRWTRAQPEFAKLPVLVLSSSDQDADVDAAYRLGANGYIVKPSAPGQLVEIVRRIKKYWLEKEGPPAGCVEWSTIFVPQREWAKAKASARAGTKSPKRSRKTTQRAGAGAESNTDHQHTVESLKR
jgi:DNA-binding response OmpR family regulator